MKAELCGNVDSEPEFLSCINFLSKRDIQLVLRQLWMAFRVSGDPNLMHSVLNENTALDQLERAFQYTSRSCKITGDQEHLVCSGFSELTQKSVHRTLVSKHSYRDM